MRALRFFKNKSAPSAAAETPDAFPKMETKALSTTTCLPPFEGNDTAVGDDRRILTKMMPDAAKQKQHTTTSSHSSDDGETASDSVATTVSNSTLSITTAAEDVSLSVYIPEDLPFAGTSTVEIESPVIVENPEGDGAEPVNGQDDEHKDSVNSNVSMESLPTEIDDREEEKEEEEEEKEEEGKAKEEEDGKDERHCGETDADEAIQWCKVPGEKINLRSLHYRTTQKKIPSAGELYECLAMDVVETPQRIPHMSSRVDLSQLLSRIRAGESDTRPPPHNTEATNGTSNTTTTTAATTTGGQPETALWQAPDLFVVTVSLPLDPSAKGDNGPCHTISMYFGMKPETRQLLQHISSAECCSGEPGDHPKDGDDNKQTSKQEDGNVNKSSDNIDSKLNAVRLFNEWCQKSPQDPKFQGRFKFIGQADNLGELGIPNWISRWNGKPILIKRSGTTGFLYQHHTYNNNTVMEMEISFHPFPWATKKALSYLRKTITHKALPIMGFVIEGREEAELPEVLIGLCQLCYPKTKYAQTWDTFINQRSNSSDSNDNSNDKDDVTQKAAHDCNKSSNIDSSGSCDCSCSPPLSSPSPPLPPPQDEQEQQEKRNEQPDNKREETEGKEQLCMEEEQDKVENEEPDTEQPQQEAGSDDLQSL